jgi:hypothetical protein
VGQRWINGGKVGNGSSVVVWECGAERLAGTRSEGVLLVWRVNVDMVFCCCVTQCGANADAK